MVEVVEVAVAVVVEVGIIQTILNQRMILSTD